MLLACPDEVIEIESFFAAIAHNATVFPPAPGWGPDEGGIGPAPQPQTDLRLSGREFCGVSLPATPHRITFSRVLTATSLIAMSDMQELICGSAVVPYKITDLRDRAAA